MELRPDLSRPGEEKFSPPRMRGFPPCVKAFRPVQRDNPVSQTLDIW